MMSDQDNTKIYNSLQTMSLMMFGVFFTCVFFYVLKFIPTISFIVVSFLAMCLIEVVSLRYSPSTKEGDDS